MGSTSSIVNLLEKFNLVSYVFCVFIDRKHPIFYIHDSIFGKFLISLLTTFQISWIRMPKKIRYPDFPGLYFDVKIETGMYVNDAIFKKYRKNLYRNIVLKFGNDERYDVALKKELYNRYTIKRVKTYLASKYLSSNSTEIVFFPVDNEPIQNYLSEDICWFSRIHIHKLFSFITTFLGAIKNSIGVVIYPLVLMALFVKVCLNGFILRNPSKDHYDFGFDISEYGVTWSRPYSEFFLYDNNLFRPSRILHVFRGKILDERTKMLFEKYHYPFAEYQQQKIPVLYFIHRLIGGLLFGSFKSLFLSLFRDNTKTLLFIPSFAVIKMTIEIELLYKYFNIKIFIARDDYSPVHVIRTIVAQSKQCHTIGFMHGDYSISGEEICTNLLFDRYGIYGTFYHKLHVSGYSLCNPVIIGAGIYGLDKTHSLMAGNYYPAKYKQHQNKNRIILIVGSSYGEDIFVNKEMTLRFYEDVLDSTKEYLGILRIIKPKNDEFSDPDFKRILHQHHDVVVDNSTWIYRLLAVSDLVICINATTVGLEAITAGKKVLFYEVTGFKDHIYAQYSPGLVSVTKEELSFNIDAVLNLNRYIDEKILEKIRADHAFVFDGNVIKRFKKMCTDLLDI